VPDIVPAFGATSAIVNTRGSGVGGAPGIGFVGEMVELEGKRM
jgi:hypothetical protein